jgi:signal recognition particle subunit SRP19
VRKRDKIVVWPVYFDSTKSRAEGRRVIKSLAVSSPELEEIRKAVEIVDLQAEIVLDAAHPSNPLRKTGLLYVPRKGSKTETLRKIAGELMNVRGKK